MDNAAKWSPAGEHVGVRLRQLNASHAELVVSDHGPGIPEHERELVFERFFRSTTARAMPGSGLGLAIVKQVVLKHGGALRVEETVPGGQPPGTSIFVLLPGRPIPVSDYPADETTRWMWTTRQRRGTLQSPSERCLSRLSDHAGKVVIQLLFESEDPLNTRKSDLAT